jgi:hypothetical protein
MTTRTADTSQRTAAIVAGLAYLIPFMPAVFANFFVFSSLIVPQAS